MRILGFFLQVLVVILVMGVVGIGLVFAAEPEYTASPSAQPTASASVVSCGSLVIKDGNKGVVPTTVEFGVEIEGDESGVVSYRYHFGDGVVEDGEKEMSHRYTQAGEYEVYVELETGEGGFVTSDGCKQMVTVRAVPLLAHRSACTALAIVDGDNIQVPAVVKMLVEGSDNKGKIQGYKVDFGDGESSEQEDSNEFGHTYAKAGTYELKAEIKDSEGNWVSDKDCDEELSVKTTVMEEQPETGVPTILTVMALAAVAGGIMMRKLALRRV